MTISAKVNWWGTFPLPEGTALVFSMLLLYNILIMRRNYFKHKQTIVLPNGSFLMWLPIIKKILQFSENLWFLIQLYPKCRWKMRVLHRKERYFIPFLPGTIVWAVVLLAQHIKPKHCTAHDTTRIRNIKHQADDNFGIHRYALKEH